MAAWVGLFARVVTPPSELLSNLRTYLWTPGVAQGVQVDLIDEVHIQDLQYVVGPNRQA